MKIFFSRDKQDISGYFRKFIFLHIAKRLVMMYIYNMFPNNSELCKDRVKMRAALVIQLVEAFHLGSSAFRRSVEAIVKDEAQKGNDDIATKLINALNSKTKSSKRKDDIIFEPSTQTSFAFSHAVAPKFIPQDKDSLLSLFEIINPKIGFDQLFYSDEVTNAFQQIIQEWKSVDLLAKVGMTPSRRILLYGPPGCGKTIAGCALAKTINMPVAYVRMDGLFSSFLGQTSANLRRIFESVVSPPRVLFLDEFDAVAKKRDDNQEIGEIKRIVISLLQNLDFLSPEVLVIAATNHEHILDTAIWRRFDISLSIGYPEKNERKKMLETWLRDHNVYENVDIEQLAMITEHLSVSRIKDIVFHAIKRALIMRGTQDVSTDDFIQQMILMEGYRQSKKSLLSFAQKLRTANITLNNIEKITGIPKSTIADNTKKVGAK